MGEYAEKQHLDNYIPERHLSLVLLLSQFAQISVQQAPNSSVSTNLTNSSSGVANDTIKNAFDSLRDTFGSQFVK